MYFISPFDALPFFLTSSMASSFHSSSVYTEVVLKMPTETEEEKMTMRLMLPLEGFRKRGVRTSGRNA